MCCVCAVQEKLRNIQIGSLIGKPLGWTSGEEEVRDFRAKMARLFDFDNWELGEKGFANIQQVLCPLLPLFFSPLDALHQASCDANAHTRAGVGHQF